MCHTSHQQSRFMSYLSTCLRYLLGTHSRNCDSHGCTVLSSDTIWFSRDVMRPFTSGRFLNLEWGTTNKDYRMSGTSYEGRMLSLADDAAAGNPPLPLPVGPCSITSSPVSKRRTRKSRMHARGPERDGVMIAVATATASSSGAMLSARWMQWQMSCL